MKKIIAFLLCLTEPSWGAWTLKNHTTGCTGSSSPCALTVPSTTAGNLLVGVGLIQANGGTMTSITGGTSVHPAGCAGNDVGTARSSDVAYVLSATGGSTSITFTASAAFDTVDLLEYSYTGTPISFDVCSNRDQSVAAVNIAGVSCGTLTGTNDAIIQLGVFSGNASAPCPNSAASPADFPNGDSACGLINTTNNAAGTYTNTSSAGPLSSIAFKETAGTRLPRNIGLIIR